ncbi:MAG TPA: guanylate kinase [Candidatus Hydrogenedentes bacterium]|nr:guanylate kinase [Candidatus Hydrogenedentota bacterium]HPG66404.1 guanylate kinase [Candidatus Hydrogenedentota bacterium]
MNDATVGRGQVLVVSGPSGAGKRAVLGPAMARDPRLVHSVSATTRAPRPGEVNGRDYWFVTPEAFRRHVEAGDFVEWAEVHGNRYGTLHEELDRKLDSGHDVILELDVQGMRAIRAQRRDVATVFIIPPSFEELERRIRGRKTDTEASIMLRLTNARAEMAARDEYDYVVLNDDLDKAIEDFLGVVRRLRERRKESA